MFDLLRLWTLLLPWRTVHQHKLAAFNAEHCQ